MKIYGNSLINIININHEENKKMHNMAHYKIYRYVDILLCMTISYQ